MRISKELKVGVLAVVSITVLYFGFNFLKGIDFFSTTNTYYAYYDNIGGLKPSNPVIINGFPAGRVSDTRFLQRNGNKILVEIDISSDIRINKGSKARLYNIDFITSSKAIELVLNTESGSFHQDGDTLESYVDEGLGALLTEGERLVTEDLTVTMSRLNNLLESLGGNSQKINTTLDNLSATSAELKNLLVDNRSNLDNTFTNLKAGSETLAQALEGLESTLKKTDTFVDSLNALQIGAAVNDLRAMLQTVNTNLEAVSNQEGTLGKLIHNDSVYNNLNHSIAHLDSLLIDIKENPKRYVQISVFGKK